MSIFRDLPKDLVEEILCFVPATNLKRLGSTCKRWNRLCNGGDNSFARKHTDKAAKQCLALMLTRSYRICPTIFNLHSRSVEVKSELSLGNSQFDTCQVFHCDGLLLCTSEYESRFVVWNPFTGETRWFQPRGLVTKGREYVLGYSNNKRYKILSFDVGRDDYEIYEFSNDSWRTLDDIIPPGWRIGYSYNSMSLKGNTFWFARDGTKTQEEVISLLKFDFSTEKTVPLHLPYQSRNFEVLLLSVVRDEKLSVLLQRHVTSKTEIWVTTNDLVELSWSKVLALDLSPDLQIWHDGSFLLDEDKKVVTICERWLDMEDESKNKDMIYIVGEDGQVTQAVLGVDIPFGCTRTILSFVPSLVQIERAGGSKRKRSDL